MGTLTLCECSRQSEKLFPKYLTSFLAFLGRFGLLGKAGVQPGGGLAVVTEVQKKSRASVGLKNFLEAVKISAISTGASPE